MFNISFLYAAVAILGVIVAVQGAGAVRVKKAHNDRINEIRAAIAKAFLSLLRETDNLLTKVGKRSYKEGYDAALATTTTANSDEPSLADILFGGSKSAAAAGFTPAFDESGQPVLRRTRTKTFVWSPGDPIPEDAPDEIKSVLRSFGNGKIDESAARRLNTDYSGQSPRAG